MHACIQELSPNRRALARKLSNAVGTVGPFGCTVTPPGPSEMSDNDGAAAAAEELPENDFTRGCTHSQDKQRR